QPKIAEAVQDEYGLQRLRPFLVAECRPDVAGGDDPPGDKAKSDTDEKDKLRLHDGFSQSGKWYRLVPLVCVRYYSVPLLSRKTAATSMSTPRQDGDNETMVRERILEAAFATFMEHGYASTSTLDIATRARVSKRELYARVGNKQEMLVACITERVS